MSRSLVPAGVLGVALLAGCSAGTEPPGPAARLEPASDTLLTSVVGEEIRDSLAVRVLDSRGRGVPGHPVTWSSFSFGAVVSPGQSLSDERGRARSALRLGTLAGEFAALAQTLTVDGPREVRFRVLAAPGPVSTIEISPSGALLGVGDTRQFTALRRDAYGNLIEDRPVTWSSTDPAVVSIDAQSGLARGVALGTAEISAASEGRAARAVVSVAAVSSGEDTFESNSLDRYTEHADVRASWSIADGVLTAEGSGKQSMLIRDDVLLQDGWVEAEMDRADEGGLVLRFRDRGNLYLLSLHDDGSLLGHRNLELFRRSAGEWILLAFGVDREWPRGTRKTIRFEVVGNRLTAYLDGALILEVTDSGIESAGGIGMRYNDVPETLGTDMARYLTFRWSGR